MNENINKVLDIILADDDLSFELMKKKTLDDVYEFCISIHGGYTKDELEAYMDEILIVDKEMEEAALKEENLEKVSGGKGKKIGNRIMAMSLAPLMIAGAPYPAAYAEGGDLRATPGITSATLSKKNQSSFWQRHKKKIIAAGVAGAILLGGTLLWRHHKNKDSDKSSSTDDTGKNKPNSAPKGQQGNGGYRNDDDDGNNSGKYYTTSLEQKGRENYNKFAEWWMGVPFIGKLLIGIATGGVFVDRLGYLASSINKISNAMWPISSLSDKISGWYRYVANSVNNKPADIHESVDNIDLLFKEVKGQEKAKEEVRSIVYSILHERNHARLTGEKYKKGDVLYFVGPSRVGKSLMAQGLAKYKILSPYEEAYKISASEIDSDNKKDTIIDQLFGMSSYGGYGDYGGYYGGSGGGGASAISKPKNLVKYISEHPNGIVIIDEYDKMWSKNLDEIFRSIVDSGVVNVKGQTIDCSGVTFILTSNESTQSIRGGNQDEVIYKDEDDGTGSRTHIKHDKSFLNRIRPVEFGNLSANEYEEIIRTEFQQMVNNYWILPEAAGVDIVISEKAIKDMAKAVEKKNQGASYAVALRSDLHKCITNKVYGADVLHNIRDYYKGKKIFVDFDPSNDTFILQDEDEKSGKVKPTVEKKNYSVEQYAQILSIGLKNMIDHFHKAEAGNIDVVIDSKVIEDMAKAVKKKNQGDDYAVALRNNLLNDIIAKISNAQEVYKQKDYYKGKKIFVGFDTSTDRFILKDEDEMGGEKKNKKQETEATTENVKVAEETRAADETKAVEEAKRAEAERKNEEAKKKAGEARKRVAEKAEEKAEQTKKVAKQENDKNNTDKKVKQ